MLSSQRYLYKKEYFTGFVVARLRCFSFVMSDIQVQTLDPSFIPHHKDMPVIQDLGLRIDLTNGKQIWM
ncbi:MAG: hypothetical protein R3C41_18125 [Calditrichia bacterium]